MDVKHKIDKQLNPACLARLILMICEIGDKWSYNHVVTRRTCYRKEQDYTIGITVNSSLLVHSIYLSSHQDKV